MGDAVKSAERNAVKKHRKWRSKQVPASTLRVQPRSAARDWQARGVSEAHRSPERGSDVELEGMSSCLDCWIADKNFSEHIGEAYRYWCGVAEPARVVVQFCQREDVS